jgi:hypothetical protein
VARRIIVSHERLFGRHNNVQQALGLLRCLSPSVCISKALHCIALLCIALSLMDWVRFEPAFGTVARLLFGPAAVADCDGSRIAIVDAGRHQPKEIFGSTDVMSNVP